MDPIIQRHLEFSVTHSSPSSLVTPWSWQEEASSGTGTGTGKILPQNLNVHPAPPSPQKHLLQSSIQVSPTILFLPSVFIPQSGAALILSEQAMDPIIQRHLEFSV